ncbi:MAG: hypothetical protein P1V36_11900 [Planctomycetota bacterium]|nr:hypothetical protein [Planctomycetota bacterium]
MASQDPSSPDSAHPIDPLDETGCFTLHRELRLTEMFTNREVRLVERLQAYCRGHDDQTSTDLRKALTQGFNGLGAIATAIEAYPSLQDRAKLGGIVRSGETLMRHLLESGDHGLEWALPTKALLSRTFGIAKVNFWTSLRFALGGEDANGESGELRNAVSEAIEEAVYTRLAEELYASFVTSKTMDPEVKLRAITQLMQLWEGRVGFATYRFCPLLRSAWAARCRAPRVFGTLMGTTEIASLLFQDCDPRFVEWFTGRDMQTDEVQAFEEFVFDLPFESLERVRQRMLEDRHDAIGPDEVAVYLGLPKGRLRVRIEDPKVLYSSFRTRRVKAKYRTSMRAPGPKRTAESYVLEGLLMAGDDEDPEA